MFETIFDDPRFRPDFLKIYPTLVTPGSEIEELWQKGKYSPYAEDELVDLIAYAKSLIPEYTRLQRIQRDIPAKLIVAGSKHSNFRQLAQNRLKESGKRCRCIRCREIGRLPSLAESEIQVLEYDCCGGNRAFHLRGFGRLPDRLCPPPLPLHDYRPELENRPPSCGSSMCTAALYRWERMPSPRNGSTGITGRCSLPGPRRSHAVQGLAGLRS